MFKIVTLISTLAISATIPMTVHAADCEKVTVTVEQLDAKTWRATAKDENGKVCGTADSTDKKEAKTLAKMKCGC